MNEKSLQQATAEEKRSEERSDRELDLEDISASHGNAGEFTIRNDLADYKSVVAKYAGSISSLHTLIRSILKDNAVARYQSPFKRGKLDAKRIYKLLATDNFRIFKKQRAISDKKYMMSIVVDMSGSMGYGRRSTYAKEGAILLMETLERLGFDYNILGYIGSVYTFKRFGQVLNKAIMPSLGIPCGDNNEVAVVETLDKHYTEHDPTVHNKKSIFFITDGGSDDEEATKAAVTALELKHDAVVYGIGIGGMDEKELAANYNKFLCVDNVADLPKALVNLMRGQFRRTG